MPTMTFFRLPKEKQFKLMIAAKHEFSKETYANASINQIIKEAGISRGSFYMYFEDKEDLYHYLLQHYLESLADQIKYLLEKNQGHLFLAFQQLFIKTQEFCLQEENKKFICQIVENVRLYQKNDTLHFCPNKQTQQEIEARINYDLLDPLAKKHIQLIVLECFHIFTWNLMRLLRDGISKDKVQTEFEEQLSLLQMGVQKYQKGKDIC